MDNKNLTIEKRTEFGKNSNRRLRSAGIIPAVLYAHGESENIQFKFKDFFDLFKGHISESIILNLQGTGDDQLAFVKDYHMDPISEDLVHVDFFKVTAGEAITTNVPVEVTGSAEGVKLGGVLEINEREITIECLPRELPEKFVVDVTDLGLNESIHAGDIKLEGSIKLVSNPETVIVGVHTAKAVEETEEIDSEEGAVADAAADTEESSE